MSYYVYYYYVLLVLLTLDIILITNVILVPTWVAMSDLVTYNNYIAAVSHIVTICIINLANGLTCTFCYIASWHHYSKKFCS